MPSETTDPNDIVPILRLTDEPLSNAVADEIERLRARVAHLEASPEPTVKPDPQNRPKGWQWIWWGWRECDLYWGRCEGGLSLIYAWHARIGPFEVRKWR